MTEEDKTFQALTQRLGEMVKENVELTERVKQLMSDYNKVVKQLQAIPLLSEIDALEREVRELKKNNNDLQEQFNACNEDMIRLNGDIINNIHATSLGKCIEETENPIVTTDLDIDCCDFCVLSQGRVYNLSYEENGKRVKIYFAPKAYYSAERLLECYFVIGVKGTHCDQWFIPERIHGCQYYNSIDSPFPEWAQHRDFMLALDYYNMRITYIIRDNEMERIEAMVKKINPKFNLLKKVLPNLSDGNILSLIFPDYKHLKKSMVLSNNHNSNN